MSNLSLILLNVFLILFYFGIINFIPKEIDTYFVILVLFINAVNIFLFFLKKEQLNFLKNNYLKHSFLFILGYIIVYFQKPLDFVFGFIKSNDSFIWINTNIVSESLVYSSIGLSCYFIGYLFSKQQITEKDTESKAISEIKLQNTNILLIISTILLILYFKDVNPLYLSGHYGTENMGESATRYILLFKVVIFCIVIIKTWNFKILKKENHNLKEFTAFIGIPILTIIGIYLISVLISGDRGPLMSYGLLLISSFFITTQIKLNFKKIIFYTFIAGIIISSLGKIRNFDKNLTFYEKIIKLLNSNEELKNNDSVLPFTSELSNSINTFHATVNYCKNNDYFYGRFQIQQVLISIPFSLPFFNAILFNPSGEKTYNTSNFNTWLIQGSNSTYGNGTSILADIYIDFGLVGIIIFLTIFGYLSRYFEIIIFSKNHTKSLIAFIFSIVYLTSIFYTSRSSILFEFQFIGWMFIFLLLNKIINFKKST